jgi:hypothetical protein
MKTASGLLTGALALSLAGAILLAAGRYDGAVVRAQRDFAAQQYARADASLEPVERYLQYGRWLPPLERALAGVRTRRAAIRYWQREYERIIADQRAYDEASPSDADLQLIAANAVYRRVQTQAADRQKTLDALQTATSAYLAVLRNAPAARTAATAVAAYNYEYVVRTRDDIDKGRRAPELTDTAEDGPAGKKGGAPPDPPKTDNLKMLVPLDPGEMDQGLAPGRGGLIERKG